MEDNKAVKLLNACLNKAGIYCDKIYFYEDILEKNIIDDFTNRITFKEFNDMLNYILENLKDYHDEKLTDYLIESLNDDLYDNFKKNDTFREILLNLFWEALDSENKYEFQNVLYFYEHLEKIEKFNHVSFENINNKGLLLEAYEQDSDFHKMIDHYVYDYLDTLERINKYNENNRKSTYKVESTINEKVYNLTYNVKKLLDVDYEEISKSMIALFLLYDKNIENKADILLFFLNSFNLDLRDRNDIIESFSYLSIYRKIINREIFAKSYLYLKNNLDDENKILYLKLEYYMNATSGHISFSEEELDELLNIYLYENIENYEEEDIKKLVRVNPLFPLNLI